MSVKFLDLLNAAKRLNPNLETLNIENNNNLNNILIKHVVSDSREVLDGTLFCCITGDTSDGHNYAADAEKKGAVAFVCEHKINNIKSNLPQIIVKSPLNKKNKNLNPVREIMGELSALVYENPSEKLLMIGVTGTNGKTTTTYIIRSILEAAGIKTGLLGTIIESDGVTERDADRTTPESCVVQRQLAAMVKNKCGACVMETSSHGLFLGRLKGARYDIPVFTNLYPEHLDFHVNMENYFEAKRLLFANYTKKNFIGAANAANEYGARLVKEFENVRGFALDLNNKNLNNLKLKYENDKIFARVLNYKTSLKGTEIDIEIGANILKLRSPLIGDFNVWNVLCAVTALYGRVDDEFIIKGVASVPQVPGRLERYILPNGACCFIDFAHTPSALKSVLKTIRDLKPDAKIISLFGHGGGRYPQNRPELGKAADEFADEVIVTMDNSRDEDPGKIAEAIASGINKKSYKIILNRPEAINYALNNLKSENDILVVTGKGPEKYILVKGEKIPHNDANAVKEWCASYENAD